MKIAVLGSASSSVLKAPFQNEAYTAWMQGRHLSAARAHAQISGEFDIWGCSPGCWGVAPRATRWFEVHRWEPGQPWFNPDYCQFLRDFKGPVYTGGRVPEITNAVVYPLDMIEEKFASYFLTSSLALMMALAIDTIEKIRLARAFLNREQERAEMAPKINIIPGAVNWAPMSVEAMRAAAKGRLPEHVDESEIDKPDSDDIIGLWGVDMAAAEEYGYQRPGCQFFVLEAMRRGIGVFLPPESDLMRPMPVYGVSEWDHNYIKLTSRAREISGHLGTWNAEIAEKSARVKGAEGEMAALQSFVNTWTSPYGMQHGMVIRQAPGTGLGSGITSFDGRPITRMTLGEPAPASKAEVVETMKVAVALDVPELAVKAKATRKRKASKRRR